MVYSLAKVERVQRADYSWYNDFPIELLDKDYVVWWTRPAKVRQNKVQTAETH